jgi:AcrB/AcrD/AcrF family
VRLAPSNSQLLLILNLGAIALMSGFPNRGRMQRVVVRADRIGRMNADDKDAILIIEFAKDLRARGKPLIEATVEACALRFRLVIMTGLAFICGGLPKVIAQGAGGAAAGARQQRDGRHDRRRQSRALDGAGFLRRRGARPGAGLRGRSRACCRAIAGPDGARPAGHGAQQVMVNDVSPKLC